MVKNLTAPRYVISVPETAKGMKPGERALFSAAETIAFASARTTVCRLNSDSRYGSYRIWSDDNGCTYTIERVK